MLKLNKGLLPCSGQNNSPLPSSANRADQACHLLACSDMGQDSCNHTTLGSLQERPSLCPSSSPFCHVRKTRPQGKKQQKGYEVSDVSFLGLPEFTLTQWDGRNSISSRLRDSKKEQQGEGDGQRMGREKMDRESYCEKAGGSGVEELFSVAAIDVGSTSLQQLPDWALESSSFIAFSSCYLNRTLFSRLSL